MEVDFCSACGKVVQRDFLYCPYCSQDLRRGSSLEAVLEGPFERLERHRDELAFERLSDAVRSLELELDQILEKPGVGPQGG